MVGAERSVGDGVVVDGGYQHIAEAPAYNDPDGETVAVADNTETGELTAENVPDVSPRTEVPDVDGQSTWEDWGWSS